MQNLMQLTETVKETYGSLPSYEVSSETISLTDTGCLDTGKNQFPVLFESQDQLADKTHIPKHFFQELPPNLQAVLFNWRWQRAISDGVIPRHMRVNLNAANQVIGFDDPRLLRISLVKLMEVIRLSLPKELSPEQVSVARFDSTPQRLWISCFSPDKRGQPRAGDIINGGVDVVHYLSGNKGTQISCYLRRLQCANGAVVHVCRDDHPLRARRLLNGRFDEADMLGQIHRLLSEAWTQLPEKMRAIEELRDKDRMPIEYLRQQRTRFSLNERMLTAIERAINQDELGPTGKQWDIFNALSRVATHDESLTFRQRRTLSRMAGEFSQQTAHRCAQCGQWVREQDDAHTDDSVLQEQDQSE